MNQKEMEKRQETYEKLMNICREFDNEITEIPNYFIGVDTRDRFSLIERIETLFYATIELLTECETCKGKGFLVENIVDYNGGESAGEWAGAYEIQCPCTHEMSIQDTVAYEKWVKEGGENESKDSNSC